jgi:biotin transport system substrate-specific component
MRRDYPAMADEAAQPRTLIEALWPRTAAGGTLRAGALVLAGVALLTLSARLKVPFYPVPMTMQTLAVLLLGIAYGARLGALSLTAYLLAGAAGLPLFADTPEKGLGLAYMLGPTGGYLIGFLAAAALVGAFAERGWSRGFAGLLALMLLGHAVIFACGVGWLSHRLGFARAWVVGMEPFYLATVLKSLAGAALAQAGWRLRRG